MAVVSSGRGCTAGRGRTVAGRTALSVPPLVLRLGRVRCGGVLLEGAGRLRGVLPSQYPRWYCDWGEFGAGAYCWKGSDGCGAYCPLSTPVGTAVVASLGRQSTAGRGRTVAGRTAAGAVASVSSVVVARPCDTRGG